MDGDGRNDIVFSQTHYPSSDRGALFISFMGGLVASPSPSTTPAAPGQLTDGIVKIADGAGGMPSGSIAGGSQFGAEVVSLGDVDGDAVDDLGVWAINDNDGFTMAGAMYVLFLH